MNGTKTRTKAISDAMDKAINLAIQLGQRLERERVVEWLRPLATESWLVPAQEILDDIEAEKHWVENDKIR